MIVVRSILLMLLLALFCGVIATGEPFAVVELFTSQGCGSCPKAESVVRDLNAYAREAVLRVFPIEWHVDYWDRLGWHDPFGDASHSLRQRRYARVFGSQTIYTPQLIVNGTTVVRPAQRRQLVFDEVEHALTRPAKAEVSLAAEMIEGSLNVTYAVSKTRRRAVLMLVVVERGLGNHVPRGGNAGKTLRHNEVARVSYDIGRVGRKATGTTSFTVPMEIDWSMASLIAIVHDAVTLEILGADSVDLA